MEQPNKSELKHKGKDVAYSLSATLLEIERQRCPPPLRQQKKTGVFNYPLKPFSIYNDIFTRMVCREQERIPGSGLTS
jgi:hypothetical protein